jgi:hypothetical protein
VFQIVTTVRGGACNSPLVTKSYDTADEARTAAKQLMHENGRIARIMIVERNGASRFVEWMDKA